MLDRNHIKYEKYRNSGLLSFNVFLCKAFIAAVYNWLKKFKY